MGDLISIREAAQQGIERVRNPIWSIPMDHLKIDIIDGGAGPWTHLFSPFNKECNGVDPFDIPFVGMDYDSQEYEPYTGPVADSEEYKAEQDKYNGILSKEKGS